MFFCEKTVPHVLKVFMEVVKKGPENKNHYRFVFSFIFQCMEFFSFPCFRSVALIFKGMLDIVGEKKWPSVMSRRWLRFDEGQPLHYI